MQKEHTLEEIIQLSKDWDTGGAYHPTGILELDELENEITIIKIVSNVEKNIVINLA